MHSKKFQVQLRNEKYPEKHYDYGKTKIFYKESDDDEMGNLT